MTPNSNKHTFVDRLFIVLHSALTCLQVTDKVVSRMNKKSSREKFKPSAFSHLGTADHFLIRNDQYKPTSHTPTHFQLQKSDGGGCFRQSFCEGFDVRSDVNRVPSCRDKKSVYYSTLQSSPMVMSFVCKDKACRY